MSTVREIVTNQVIDMLSQGIIPWERPWVAGSCAPRGYDMKPDQHYTGINRLLLPFQGEYLTGKMVAKYGGEVLDKSQSFIVTFKAPAKANEQGSEEEADENGIFRRWIFRYYRVYHISNTSGIEPRVKTRTDEADSLRPVERAEELVKRFIEKYKVKVEVKRCDNPHYDEATDTVTVPLMEQFHNEESYYHTLFQELIHATGHVDRLCRDVKKNGTDASRREDIVGEMGASFLMADAGLDITKIQRNSTAHIAMLLDALHQDSGLVCWAAPKAEKAYNMIAGTAE